MPHVQEPFCTLASPLKCGTIQSGQTNNPSKDKDEAGDEVGLDASHHTRIFLRGGENLFFLTSSLQKLNPPQMSGSSSLGFGLR
jgi:hypothetical protein